MTNFNQLKQLLKLTKYMRKPLIRATLFGSAGHLTLVLFIYLLTQFFFVKITSIAIILFIVLVVLAFLKGFLSYTEQLLNHYVAFKILHILRVKVMQKFKRISIDSFTRNSSGDYMTTITTDVELLEVFYAHTITPFFIYIIQSLVVSLFLAFFSWNLALLSLIIYIIIGLIYPLGFKDKGQEVGDDYRRKLTKINNNSSEEAYGIFETIQYNKVSDVKKQLQFETDELITSSYAKTKFLIDLNMLNIVTYNFGVLAFIITATKVTTNNSAIALSAMFIVSFIPILYMGNLASTLSQTLASGKRFLELMNIPEEELNTGQEVDFKQLQVTDLSYSYGDNKVISNINFTANKGEIIGISGESGSGKSTLAKLIMKFISNDNMTGNISIDNIPLDNIDNEFFRNNSSIILQDSYLFNTSIKNNLNFFDKNISKDKLDFSLKNTNLTKFINSLPKKENEMIGEMGSNISAGQKQRMSVARSFYNDSKLLILDEATSNIDIFSEIDMLNALKETKEDRITIIISHNKTTLSICDRVIKL